MRLAIVGSSSISDSQTIEARQLIRMYGSLDPDLIISGGALGVDDLAEEYADSLFIPTKILYPAQPTWPAYKARNILIAEDCTHLLCIRSVASATYGSGWTADYADALGKTVWRYLI